MAEPLAVLGTMALVSQLTGQLVQLTTNLRHHLKVVRRAPEEVQAFLMETSTFTGLINFFTELADNHKPNMGRRQQRKRDRLISNVQSQCAYVCDKMAYLVDRFAELADGKMSHLGM
ncbi:hypothetical protein F4803DRAFT_58335 [Xylaria telfairii]|nr:hypothetical protein F4803DRAFT_58335 [Xylaria telfairii]